MKVNYVYTPEIWPSIISAFCLIALAAYSFNRRNVPGAIPFTIGCLAAIPIGLSMVMTLVAVDIDAKIFWYQFESTWLIICVTAMTCFILEYTWPGRWLTRRNLVLLSIPPILSIIFNITNNSNHLAFRGFDVDKVVIPHYGPAGWIYVGYLLLLSLIDIIVFIWLFRVSPQHRWPVAIMLTALILVRIIYLSNSAITGTWLLIIPEYSFVFLAYGVALFGFRLFDPMDQACQSVMDQMHEGMLVLDSNKVVAKLNPAAEKMINIPARSAQGKHIRDLLPDFPAELQEEQGEVNAEFSLIKKTPSAASEIPTKKRKLNNRNENPGGIPTEGHLTDQASQGQSSDDSKYETRNYILRISTLHDWRGLKVGCLLLLRDLTDRKQAQEKIINQQRALAMLQEREQLARELHDSIGQVLGYAGFQVESALKLIQDGQINSAQSQLTRLAGVVRDAHADVRKYIFDLRTEPDPHELFSITLRHYLDGFTNNYNIQTNLYFDDYVNGNPLPSDVQMHLFRIIQEALTNTRKHSQAHCVQVALIKRDSHLRLSVSDDGVGFEREQIEGEGGSHFGLHFMRERAEKLGGDLTVDSEPGTGTRVVLEMPLVEL